MKGAALAAVALALAGAPVSAQTPFPLFDTFKRVCVDSEASYARTSVNPEMQGWSKFPLPIPLPVKDVKLSKKTIRFKSFGENQRAVFMAGQGTMRAGERTLPLDLCVVGAKPADRAAVLKAAQALTGQPPVSSSKGKQSFRYLMAKGVRTALPPGSLRELAAQRDDGVIVSLDVSPEREMLAISYSVLRL